MNLDSFLAQLAFAPQPQPGTTPNPTGAMLQMLGPLLVLGVMFYVLLIRPQQKRQREHNELIRTLKAGDKIVTTGGVLGTVVSVKEKSVSIRSADAKMEILKSAVSEITEKAANAPES